MKTFFFRFKNLFVCSVLLVVFNFELNAQVINTKGVPYIQHFENGKIDNFSQIWDIAEAPNNMMYFVNETGLLEYDGLQFNVYKGSKGITRSIKVQSNDTIYTGSDDDFGIWIKNKNQKFEYTSLYQKIKNKSTVIEEFWNIYFLDDTIVFQSFNNLYCLENQFVTKVNAPFRFIAGLQGKNKIYLVDQQYGFYEYDHNGLQKKDINNETSIDFSQIIALDEKQNHLYVITKNKGIFVYNAYNFIHKIPYEFEKPNDEVFSYTAIRQNYFVLGTIQNGIFIIDNNGKTIHRLNKIKGIQNNTVLSIYCSRYGKLWLGLDFGIDVLHLSSPYSFVLDSEGKIGTTYTALLDDNTLFLGTNQGLFSTKFSDLENFNSSFQYQFVPNSQGQVWTLTQIDQQIYCGHNKGLYVLHNNQIIQVDQKPGVWSIVKMNNAILTGNYNGIHLYKKNDKERLDYVKPLSEVKGSCNQLLVYKDKLFVVLGNIGLLELTLNTDFEVKQKEFYDKKIFGNEHYYIYIKGDSIVAENLKFRFTKSISGHHKFKKQPKSVSNDLLDNINKNAILPNRIDDKTTIYSIYNGFALYNSIAERNDFFKKTPQPIIRNTEAFNNNQKIQVAFKDKLAYRFNNIKFQFIVPNAPTDVKYQYYLKGYSGNHWSSLTSNSSIDFLNLKEGTYHFLVRAKTSKGFSEEAKFTFQIKPPFYRTWWAYLCYVLTIIGTVFWIKNLHSARLKRQKLSMLKEQKERLNEQSVKYQERIMVEKNQKLELEKQQLRKTIENKELELAKKIIDQKEINELIQSIKRKVEDVQQKSTQKLSIKNYKELMTYLDKKINKELNKEYEIAFDSSQTLFHENLLKRHPHLSAKDLRISSYIIMNLSSKEIAKILQVLPTSIDVNRSRLRKKLDIEDDINLREYLLKFQS